MENSGHPSTESKQTIEPTLGNSPYFIKCRTIVAILDINEFLMLLFNYSNLTGALACQQAFVMLPENRTESIMLQNKELMRHDGRHFNCALVHLISLSNNSTDSSGGFYIQCCHVLG